MSDLTASEREQLKLFRHGLKKLAAYEEKLKSGKSPELLRREFDELKVIDDEIVKIGISAKLARALDGILKMYYSTKRNIQRERIISAADFGE